MARFQAVAVSIVLALAAVAPLPASAASPAPSPTIVPLGDFTHLPGTEATEGLDWQPAVAPAVEAGASLSRLTTWAGGFAVVERWRDEDGNGRYAVLASRDGRSWERSPLPEAVRDVYWLRPFRDGLVLMSARQHGYTPERFRLDTWRSDDGLDWSRVGTVGASLPPRLEQERYWGITPVELIATDQGLTLLASVVYARGAGGSTRDATVFVSGDRAAPVRAQTRPARMWGWTSADGSAWARARVSGVVDPDGYGFINVTAQAPTRILAIRGNGDALLSSRDGLRWRVEAPLPSDFEQGVSDALLWTDDGALLFGDNRAAGNEGCGNRLGTWRLEDEGGWVETLDRQPAVAKGAAADGTTVLVAGKSWCAGEWAWVIGSADGGRTWDPDLSWVGPLGSCRGEVAIADGAAVVVDCADGDTLLWAELPAPDAAPNVASDGTGVLPSLTGAAASLPGLLWPDAPVPASLAEFMPAAREQLWDQATDGLRLPLHLRFLEARCSSDGGVALVFEEIGPPFFATTYAYAVRGSMPTSPDDGWSAGTGMRSVLDDPEFVHLMGDDTVVCP